MTTNFIWSCKYANLEIHAGLTDRQVVPMPQGAAMIDMNKKYRTRDGRQVRILCIDGPKERFSVIAVVDGYLLHYAPCGTFYAPERDCCSSLDLVEVSPWDDFKVDEPVMVRDGDLERWVERHFAHTSDGLAYTWADGGTSWSTCCKIGWLHCRRPTPEELKGRAK
jgi:hypothetical protein